MPLPPRRTLLAGVTLTFVLALMNVSAGHVLPWSVVIMGSATYTMAMGATRFQSRLFAVRRSADQPAGLRVALIGAGELGGLTLRAMLANPRSGLLEKSADLTTTLVYFLGIDEAKFRRPIVPGDQMRIVVDVIRRKAVVWKMKGEVYVGSELAAEASLLSSIGQQP